MLTFSRGQRGEPRPLQLGSLVKESVKLLEPVLPATIAIRVAADGNLPTVLADPVHVEQVLMNLCINARDAMSGSGTLDISVRPIECRIPCTCTSCRKPAMGRYLELCVGDSGVGVRREVLDRIFDPFYTTKEPGKGSGMGLATVHGIVHEYGGHIRVDSEPGKGSRFCIMLPLADEATTGGTSPEADAPGTRPDGRLAGDLLLVEDDAAVREYMVDRLGDWGLTVSACANGAEALGTLARRGRPFDGYLLDFTMPGMTGIELAREIRVRHPQAQPILYTGYGEELSAEELAAAGIRQVLRKPVDIAVLRIALDPVFARPR